MKEHLDAWKKETVCCKRNERSAVLLPLELSHSSCESLGRNVSCHVFSTVTFAVCRVYFCFRRANFLSFSAKDTLIVVAFSLSLIEDGPQYGEGCDVRRVLEVLVVSYFIFCRGRMQTL